MFKSLAWFEFIRLVLAVLLAISLAIIIILVLSDSPGEAIGYFLLGPLGSLRHFGNVIEAVIPLIFTGLAVSIMFQSSSFNLGAEGAFFIGAIAATFAAVNWTILPVIHPLIAIFYGAIAGMLLCAIPGLLKNIFGASELVSSLMFNYIAFFLGLYLINYFLRDPEASVNASYRLQEGARLSVLVPGTKVHSGLVMATIVTVLSYLFMYRTTWGHRIQVVGHNRNFALYSGINTGATVLLAQILGGALAGSGGAIEVLGLYRRFSWQILPGFGWSGIIVATLARNNPLYVAPAAFVLAYLSIGAGIMSRRTDVPNEFVIIIQGIIIILIAADRFLYQWRHSLTLKRAVK